MVSLAFDLSKYVAVRESTADVILLWQKKDNNDNVVTILTFSFTENLVDLDP